MKNIFLLILFIFLISCAQKSKEVVTKIESKEFNPGLTTSMYHNNITGMLQVKKCGLNTQTQIDAILEEAEEHYSQKTIDKLKNIMIPLYLGIEDDRISKTVNTNTDKIIVFNHRPNDYRGWKPFLKVIKNYFFITLLLVENYISFNP